MEEKLAAVVEPLEGTFVGDMSKLKIDNNNKHDDAVIVKTASPKKEATPTVIGDNDDAKELDKKKKELGRKSNSNKASMAVTLEHNGPNLYGEDSRSWNRYQFREDLGNGSYGIVKLVHNREDNNLYAMKILSKRKLIRQAGFARRPPRKGAVKRVTPLDRVYQEIALLKKLNHPNVVKLVEVFDDPNEDDLCMVFELMTNGEVMSVPCDEPFTESLSRRYFRDTLLGLEYLHHQMIIHRDIKPSNLLLDDRGHVKIADLGVSQQLDALDDLISGSAGTPAFMPPESISTRVDKFMGRPLDIWSFGCTLFCFLTGNPPFYSDNIMHLHSLINEKTVDFSDHSHLSSEARDLILRMLEKDPSERICLSRIRTHPWVSEHGAKPLNPDERDNCCLVTVTDEDVEASVTSVPKLHTLIMVKSMLKHRTFRNKVVSTTVSNKS